MNTKFWYDIHGKLESVCTQQEKIAPNWYGEECIDCECFMTILWSTPVITHRPQTVEWRGLSRMHVKMTRCC